MSASFRKALFMIGIVGALSWGCTPTPAPTPTPTPAEVRDGDDRPPIIISDGSVDFYIDAWPSGRGEWKQVDAKKMDQWVHQPTVRTARAVTKLWVTILNAKRQSPPNCLNPDYVFKVDSFDIELGSSSKARVWVNAGYTQVDFTKGNKGRDAERDANMLFWLTTKGAAGDPLSGLKVKSATLPDPTQQDPNSLTTCEFSGKRAIVRVEQHSR